MARPSWGWAWPCSWLWRTGGGCQGPCTALLTGPGRCCLLWPPPTAPPIWEGLLLRTTEIKRSLAGSTPKLTASPLASVKMGWFSDNPQKSVREKGELLQFTRVAVGCTDVNWCIQWTINSHETFSNPSRLVNLDVKSLSPSLFLSYGKLKNAFELPQN